MALIRWEPVRELNTLQSEMNRLFNTLFDAPLPNGSASLRNSREPRRKDYVDRSRGAQSI